MASLNIGPCAAMAVTRVCSGLIASGGRINETMIFPSLFLATSDRRTRPLQDGTNTMVFVCCTCSGSSAILGFWYLNTLKEVFHSHRVPGASPSADTSYGGKGVIKWPLSVLPALAVWRA